MAQETTILFMAHYLSDSVLKNYESLRECCSDPFRAVMLYDNSRNDFDGSVFPSGSEYFLYESNTLASIYPSMAGHASVVPGNCIFPVLYFAESRPESHFLWRIEYDVRFGGDWSFLFRHFERSNTDLLGTTIFPYSFRPTWNWWGSVKTPDGPPETAKLLRGFLPVFRLSRNACEILDRAYRSGWTGHYEASIPTILNYYGCTIEDIGGDGDFVKPENKNRFYTNTPAAPGLAPGTFVCPPHACQTLDVPNMLYHPVKEK